MLWLWLSIVAVAAATGVGGWVTVKRRRKLPGFSKDRKGRCHYRVWGVERTSGAKCILHVDAKTPWKAEQEVAEQGIAVEGVLEVPRLRKERRRRQPSAEPDTLPTRPI